MVIGDSGSNNVDGKVDDLLEGEEMTGVLAQVEATFSNSMIAAFWPARKRSWPHLNTLDNFTALGRFIEFYIAAYKEAAPHSAFRSRDRLPTRRTLGRVMHLLLSLSPRARQLARIESRQIGHRPAAYTSEEWIPGHRYCNGQGPECHETQLVWIAVAAIFARCAAVVF